MTSHGYPPAPRNWSGPYPAAPLQLERSKLPVVALVIASLALLLALGAVIAVAAS